MSKHLKMENLSFIWSAGPAYPGSLIAIMSNVINIISRQIYQKCRLALSAKWLALRPRLNPRLGTGSHGCRRTTDGGVLVQEQLQPRLVEEVVRPDSFQGWDNLLIDPVQPRYRWTWGVAEGLQAGNPRHCMGIIQR